MFFVQNYGFLLKCFLSPCGDFAAKISCYIVRN